MQNLPCTRADYFHGVLALSDVLLENEEYREQYCEVIDSTMEAVKAMKHHRKNSKPEIDRITAVLKSRWGCTHKFGYFLKAWLVASSKATRIDLVLYIYVSDEIV